MSVEGEAGMSLTELAEFEPSADAWTTDDLERLPPSFRAEVHNGDLVILSPARKWHQRIERRICNLLESAGRYADTQVSVVRNKSDTRTADVGVVRDEPTDTEQVWHEPGEVELVVEVWSRSSERKDRNPQWYADVGIPEYWLAKPIEVGNWDARITMYELRPILGSDAPVYVETGKVTLSELEQSGAD
jgi:Uma2 family endonuclease